jgi:hypothetical protein
VETTTRLLIVLMVVAGRRRVLLSRSAVRIGEQIVGVSLPTGAVVRRCENDLMLPFNYG